MSHIQRLELLEFTFHVRHSRILTTVSALGPKVVVIVGPPGSNFGQCLAYGVDGAGNPILFIGAPTASLTASNDQSGQLYGIYTQAIPWGGTLDASNLTMPAGFVVNGTIPQGEFGCPLTAGFMVINGTQIPVFATAAPSPSTSTNVVIYVGYLLNNTIPSFQFNGTDGFSATAGSSSDTLGSIDLGGSLGPGGTPAVVVNIFGASSYAVNGRYYLIFEPPSAQFSLTSLTSPAGQQIAGIQGRQMGPASSLIDMVMNGLSGLASAFTGNQIAYISGQANGLSTGLNLSDLVPSQGFLSKALLE